MKRQKRRRISKWFVIISFMNLVRYFLYALLIVCLIGMFFLGGNP